MMSRNRLAGIIVACAIVIVAAIVLFIFEPWEGPASAGAYTLTTAVNPPGAGSVSPSGGQYESGVQVTITASPASGYTFDYWSGSASDTSPTIYITMDHDYSITANFVVASVDRYDLTISSTDGGSVTGPGEGSFTYDAGTAVHLMAEAEEGYHFVSWTGDIGTIDYVYDAMTTITMDASHSVTANFEAIPATQYTLTISGTEGGSVTGPGEGAFPYDEGTVVNLVAQAEQGYQFVSWSGDVGAIAAVDNAVTSVTVNGDYVITAEFGRYMIVAGEYHTVGLEPDGTVVAVGDGIFGRCNVGGWTDIVYIAAGGYHSVGVKSDGTVVAVGRETAGQIYVDSWTDIVQVAAGEYHTVGLKSDGTVVAVGSNGQGQCDVEGWTDVVQIAAGKSHTLGLKSDGSVVTCGDNTYLQRNLSWTTGIYQVAAGWYHTLGLRTDGTVAAIGQNDFHQCDVYSWTGIIQIAGGGYHTVGLKSDGTVVAVGRSSAEQLDVGDWTDIVQVVAGGFHTVGLKSDGTVVATGCTGGFGNSGQCDVDDWMLG
jgi:uncharacterized repeat protein (TIGR02543 family)